MRGISSESTTPRNKLTFHPRLSQIPIHKATEPLHAPLGDLPFFADSTSNQALLFSPPFLPPAASPVPTYPNYTLPQANTTAPDPPSTTPNFTLFLAPLDAGLPTTLPQTACAIRARVTGDAGTAQSAQVLQEQLWLRDESGWRREWLVGRLAPLTNYSVYAIQDGTRLSGPIYFTTKSGAYPPPPLGAFLYMCVCVCLLRWGCVWCGCG